MHIYSSSCNESKLIIKVGAINFGVICLLLHGCTTFILYILLLQVYIGGCFIMGLSSIILLLEKSPLLYHAYVFMTIFLWTRIVQNYEFLKAVWRELSNMSFKYIFNLLNYSVVALIVLELLVRSHLLTRHTF
jgi:hypothetical protein